MQNLLPTQRHTQRCKPQACDCATCSICWQDILSFLPNSSQQHGSMSVFDRFNPLHAMAASFASCLANVSCVQRATFCYGQLVGHHPIESEARARGSCFQKQPGPAPMLLVAVHVFQQPRQLVMSKAVQKAIHQPVSNPVHGLITSLQSSMYSSPFQQCSWL